MWEYYCSTGHLLALITIQSHVFAHTDTLKYGTVTRCSRAPRSFPSGLARCAALVLVCPSKSHLPHLSFQSFTVGLVGQIIFQTADCPSSPALKIRTH